MSNKHYKIISISAEVEPFSKTGGLADVARSLPIALDKIGQKTIIITPYYNKLMESKKLKLETIVENIEIKIDDKNKQGVSYLKGELNGLPVYFIKNDKFFAKKDRPYGSTHENARFYLFDLAAIKLLKILEFQPDIIHCHDWHTGLIPYLLNTRYKRDPFFEKTATVFTIHNLVFQLGKNWWEVPVNKKDDGHKNLPLFSESKIENINFAKRAILNADVINTVSETYAEEIMTKGFGQDLNRILRNRQNRLFGIVNGIDYNAYNPSTDPGLKRKFSLDSIKYKITNKKFLQKYYKLPVDKNVPLLAMTSRIVEQKGFDLVKRTIETLLGLNIQILIMGDGNKEYINFFKKLKKYYPGKLEVVPFDQKMETSVYAGADMLLLPSRFEPCGLNQLISLRYGCIPIVHHIGGLVDSIDDFDPVTKEGNGFVFKHYYSQEFLMAAVRALEIYKIKRLWKILIKNGMSQSFSWEIPAKRYLILYQKALKNKKKNGNNK